MQSRFVIPRSVHKKSSPEIPGRLPKKSSPYCPGGESAGVSSLPAAASVVPAGESVMAAAVSVAGGLVISVDEGGGVVGVGLVAGVTVSVFCSHAARSAAPARMQMYFFIVGDAHCFSTSIAASAVFDHAKCCLRHKWLATSAKTAPPISSHVPQLRPCT
jgi:hypothetical protein